jgi:tetratricopeptide (TPR) repeat protein
MGYQYRGLLLRKMSRHKESIDDWEKIVSLEPKNAYAASMVAHAWYSYGRTRADARETNMITEGRIAAALKLNPQDATLYNIRGMNRYFGKYSDNLDIEYLNEAIKIDPNVPNFYNNRGYVFANKSKWAEAVADYDKAIAVGGKNYQPFYKDYREYAVSKLASQPGASAAQMYDEAMRLYDNIQKDEAIALMNKAIALEPKNARMYFGRYKVSKYTDKSSWITKAVNLEPTNAEYMYWYGHELYLHNQDDAAIAAFDKAMKLGGTHLPEANKNVFGYNYKQNILNKRSVAANQSAIAQKNNNGSNVQVTPELIKMMQEVLATTKKTIQAKQPGVKFLKSGRFGSEGFSTKAYVQYGESLSLLLIYPSNTKVTSFSNCEPNNLGPYIMTMCTETNMSLEQAGKIFTVMVQGPGPVFYELAHIGPK